MARSLETSGGGRPLPTDGGERVQHEAREAHEATSDHGADGRRGSRDPLRELRITTAVVAVATAMLVVYALLTPQGPNRPVLLATLGAALAIHVSLLLFAGPRLGRASRQGAGGLAFLVLCFAFVSAWVALDGGTASPINATYSIPLTIAVLRVPSASRLLAGLVITSHLSATLLAHALFAGTFDPATSLVWITQFVLTTVVTAWIANMRNAQRHKLRQLTLELEDLAVRDPLTRVLNRRGFEAALSSALADPDAGTPTALVVADLDHFKRINDARGHAAGDAVLAAAASAIGDAVRGGDLVARTGGEEFAIALLDADPAEAQRVAERIRGAIATCSPDPPVTASVGVAVANGTPHLERLHLAADRAMYRAKELGRDRVHVGGLQGPPEQGPPEQPGDAPTGTGPRAEQPGQHHSPAWR